MTQTSQNQTEPKQTEPNQTEPQEPRIVGAFVSPKPFTIHYVPDHVERLPDHVSFVEISDDGRAVKPAPAFKNGYGHIMFLTDENEIMAFAWRDCWHSLAAVFDQKTGRFNLSQSEETAHMADYFDCPEIIAEQFAFSIPHSAGFKMFGRDVFYAPSAQFAAGGELFVRENGTVTEEPWPTAKASGLALEKPDARLSAYKTSRDYTLLRGHLDAWQSVVFSAFFSPSATLDFQPTAKVRAEGVARLAAGGYVFELDKRVEKADWVTIKKDCTQADFAEKCERFQILFIIPNR